MARLATKERKRIPKSDLGVPGKRSSIGGKGGAPTEDQTQARNGLAQGCSVWRGEEKG